MNPFNSEDSCCCGDSENSTHHPTNHTAKHCCQKINNQHSHTCSSHRNDSNVGTQLELNHSLNVLSDLEELFEQRDTTADIIFLLAEPPTSGAMRAVPSTPSPSNGSARGREFPAHKAVLACRSPYFRALLFGGLCESSKTEITLCAPPALSPFPSHSQTACPISNTRRQRLLEQAFQLVLRYMYTGRLCLCVSACVSGPHSSPPPVSLLLEVFRLANLYALDKLEQRLIAALCDAVEPSCACLLLNTALRHNVQSLRDACVRLIDRDAQRLVRETLDYATNMANTAAPASDGGGEEEDLEGPPTQLLCLTFESIRLLIGRDSFYVAREIDVFRLVRVWLSHHQQQKIVEQLRTNQNEAEEEEEKDGADGEAADLIGCVRLELIPVRLLLTEVRDSNLVPPNCILTAISSKILRDKTRQGGGGEEYKKENKESPPRRRERALLILEENLATLWHGCTLMSGVRFLTLHSDWPLNLHANKKNTNLTTPGEEVCDGNCNGDEDDAIVLRLGRPSLINCIHMRLYERNQQLQFHSYCVDVASDSAPPPLLLEAHCNDDADDDDVITAAQQQQHQEQQPIRWRCVIDYSACVCRSVQQLHFEEQIVRFVRIRPITSAAAATRDTTHDATNRNDENGAASSSACGGLTSSSTFRIASLKIFNTRRTERLHNEFVWPRQNVALAQSGAKVLEGISKLPNSLIQPRLAAQHTQHTQHAQQAGYDWQNGFTCHHIGCGSIVVQLAQPYWLDSLAMLLWDLDERAYSYTVEVSQNARDWLMVCDRSGQECRSWQRVEFARAQCVCLIRVTGTYNSINEVFHLVQLECPAPPLPIPTSSTHQNNNIVSTSSTNIY